MMPAKGVDTSKEYGEHVYGEGGMGNCTHGCGCHMAGFNCDGPIGIDPFGECPNNPMDGKRLGGTADQEVVVERRVERLEKRAYTAEEALKLVSPSTKKLAGRLRQAEKTLTERNATLRDIRESVRKLRL